MKVELLAFTQHPMEVMYCAWTHRPMSDAAGYPTVTSAGEIDDLWSRWIVEPTSALEFVHLSFLLLGVSRAFLAQITRHRMLGFWVQSMRTTDMSSFKFEEPAGLDDWQTRVYVEAMDDTNQSYQRLLAAGVPLEIARDVIPLGAPTNIAVAGNLRAWAGLIRSRACLMAQQGMWAPVLNGMKKAMVQVEPRFSELFAAPCRFTNECQYRHEQENRIAKGGTDFAAQPSLGVCPVYANKFHGK